MVLFGDLTLELLIAIFAVAGAIVVAAGVVLARTGDAIAVQTRLGGLFVGMLLLAGATSLPEIATDVTAAVAGSPDLAVGDLLGSSMANMAILAIIDLLHRGRVWPSIGLGHARVASIAMALTAILLLGIVTPVRIAVGWIGLETIVVVAAWILATLWVRRAQTQRTPPVPDGKMIVPIPPEPATRVRPLRVNLLVFAGAGLVVLAAAPMMALSAQAMAPKLGIAETFVGATLLALATSLPELATSLAAVRIGAYDLAVGNLFGSNALNTTVVFVADASTTSGPILAAVSSGQTLIAGLGALLLMAIALGGVVHGERTRVERGEPDAILLLLAYVILLWVLWNGA